MKASIYGEVSVKLFPSRGNFELLRIIIRTHWMNSNCVGITMNYLYNTYYKSEHRVVLILRLSINYKFSCIKQIHRSFLNIFIFFGIQTISVYSLPRYSYK